MESKAIAAAVDISSSNPQPAYIRLWQSGDRSRRTRSVPLIVRTPTLLSWRTQADLNLTVLIAGSARSQRCLAPIPWTVGCADSASAGETTGCRRICFNNGIFGNILATDSNHCIALGGAVEFEGRRNGYEANKNRARRATRCRKFSSFRHRDGLCWDGCGGRATFIHGFESDRQSPTD